MGSVKSTGDHVPRGEGGRWASGASGNPRGRPRRGDSLAECLREKIPNEQIVEKATALLASKNESTVLQALQFVAQYSGHKPPERHEVRAGSIDEPEDLSMLTNEQLAELADLEQRRASILASAGVLALTSGDDDAG